MRPRDWLIGLGVTAVATVVAIWLIVQDDTLAASVIVGITVGGVSVFWGNRLAQLRGAGSLPRSRAIAGFIVIAVFFTVLLSLSLQR